jgi:hypothetical protein
LRSSFCIHWSASNLRRVHAARCARRFGFPRDETCGAEIAAETYGSFLDLTPLSASLPLRPI